MGVLFLMLAAVMAAATFLENDYGSGAAYSIVYNAWWFELLFLLLAVNLIGQMVIFKLYRKEKITIMLFHLSFVLMITGAAITRYTGWEGSMHIREGEDQNLCYSDLQELAFTVRDSNGNLVAEHSEEFVLTSASADKFREKVRVGNETFEIVLARVIPNAEQSVSEKPGGEPMVSLIVSKDRRPSESLILGKGETKRIFDVSIGFEPSDPADMKITADSGSFYLHSASGITETSMMTQEKRYHEPGAPLLMQPRTIISTNGTEIVPVIMTQAGEIKPVPVNPSEKSTGQNALVFYLSGDGTPADLILWDKSSDVTAADSVIINGNSLKISFGSPAVLLPFRIGLADFVLERYPGSNSPSGYKSNVVLTDQVKGIEKQFSIYMNNILKYRGFRFYQSSYDTDELGTILSVNRDIAGMLVTYTGYGLLFLFIILSLLNRKSVFRTIKATSWSSALRKTVLILPFVLLVSGFAETHAQRIVPDRNSAEEFGKILVQDQKGRTKPLSALSNDILRKVARESNFEGLTPTQVFMGILVDFDNWKDVPVIKVSNRELQRSLGIFGSYAAFSDIVDMEGAGYKLSAEVNRAYSVPPAERTKTDKEIMKVDERVNIVYMIYNEGFLKIFPLKDGSHNWGSPDEALKSASGSEDSLYLSGVLPMLAGALKNGDVAAARQIAVTISDYQERFSEYDLPSGSKTKAEILYYKLMIFERLFPFYATTGIVMLVLLIVMVIRAKKEIPKSLRILQWLLFSGFLVHTSGLVLRWYISGHSPMSNGYESMIFISWVTLLAGFIFSRKSAFALSATAVLAGMTLMVAHLSFMDPEITNLVPVLKSYWLTLHVSVITGSYGFLGLGAILGIITMILLLLTNERNRERISVTIDELLVINYRSLTLGLYFLTIGTFLGAVWANESWGRYWGWDPKETWSLITIVIYSLVIHSRLIPGMKDIYTFNLLSLFAFASVLMTYFGVNYYLSGLHSYAGGDPVPVPSFVYVTVITLVALAWFSYSRYRKWVPEADGGKK